MLQKPIQLTLSVSCYRVFHFHALWPDAVSPSPVSAVSGRRGCPCIVPGTFIYTPVPHKGHWKRAAGVSEQAAHGATGP